ncbi:ATP-binding protein [Enterobacter hormaechei]|jgi:hypothetical protein|uniref:AAA family ATPase n=1 Tax=Enterobacter hormaechei TaxID=158836 RepID=UPI00188C4BFC|nr:ATP-binding protein [Enterobacter hormaechei]ELC6413590.1 ATP-binding protein [Enterobacter hormaechei]MBF4166786.1 ATP-binding protein [Enterobacter hormaechei]
MKLRKIKWNNHTVLGNLFLDFVNSQTNKPYNTILLAGENGTGKSTILDEISQVLNYGSHDGFDYIEYQIGDNIFKTSKLIDRNNYGNFFQISDENNNIKQIRYDKSYSSELINSDEQDLRRYGCVYSRARSDYKTQPIISTTISELDKITHDVDVLDDFTSLKQLIVDVVNQDSSDYVETNIVLGNNPQPWDVFYPTSKLFRFKNAFDAFFDKMKYEKVADKDGEKSILFSKNGKSIPIDKLSTGEKQVVFRGIFLLRNTNALDGAVIMIDEPELSMHPKWEKKILSYYQSLFFKSNQQTAQIIFATHSDHVLKEALANTTDNIVVTLVEKNGTIECRNIDAPTVLPSITSAETNYFAFDVVSNDYHIELYGWLQDKENLNSVKRCDDFIKNHSNYDPLKHAKLSNHLTTTYETLCTYIRNAIHHPDSGNKFTESELRTSIEFLIDICK